MIHISKKAKDYPFIHAIIAKRHLSVVPAPGYESAPGAWDENARWKRSVERYPWGVILFLSDAQANRHATVVVEGQFDLDSGTVVDKSGEAEPEILPLEWYTLLARTFQGKGKSMEKVDPPPCLGYHQGDFVCDGGYNNEGVLEPACAWRSRCIAVQNLAAKVARTPAEMFKGKTAEQITLASFKAEQVAGPIPPPPPVAVIPGRDAVSVAMGQPADPEAGQPGASRSNAAGTAKPASRPVAAGAGVSKKAVAQDSMAQKAYRDIMDGLRRAMPGRQFLPTKDGARPGDVYVIDRSASSAYLSVYVQPDKGRAIGLFAFRLRTLTPGVQLPMMLDSTLLDKVRAHTVSWNDGVWHTEVKPVPTSVPVETIVEILVEAIKSGAIPAPAPAGK